MVWVETKEPKGWVTRVLQRKFLSIPGPFGDTTNTFPSLRMLFFNQQLSCGMGIASIGFEGWKTAKWGVPAYIM
jgi:hypothetical protein